MPRTKLPLKEGYSVLWHVRALLPWYDEWRRQVEERGGDKSGTAKKFLEEIIPYFVWVLIQDGVFLVQEFPDNPISVLLRQRIQEGVDGGYNYVRWALSARRRCTALARTRESRDLDKLTEGASAAFSVLSSRVDVHNTLMEGQNRKIAALERQICPARLVG